jgi:methyl-accepting chemotaxis protein
MHPYKPELMGRYAGDMKDPGGTRLFAEMARVCMSKGAGFVDYIWDKPGESRPVPKISYVKMTGEWKWIIGTGIYVDDIEKEMGALKSKVIGGLIAGAAVLVLMAIFLAG